MEYRKEKITDVIHQMVSGYIQLESNRTSMITVTRVDVSSDFKTAIIFVTVFPEDQENAALDFLKRNRKETKDYIKSHSRLARLPRIDYILDTGEKSRQRLDEISKDL